MRAVTAGMTTITLVTVLVVSGCAGGATEDVNQQGRAAPSPSTSPSETAPGGGARPDTNVELSSSPMVEEIKQRGRLLVGVSADDPRFVERSGAGEYSGFDVEMARLLADGLDLNPEQQVAFRRLPATMLHDGVAAGNVDLLLGPPQQGLTAVGPYAITGDQRREITVRPGDERFVAQLRGILDDAVANGDWQRAYDKTLDEQGIPAKPE